MKKFIFAPDIHFGYERKNGHKIPLHDQTAVDAMLEFAADFKPDTFILGGDSLDCGAISHHNHHKPGRTEGMRLLSDAEECRKNVITPIEESLPHSTLVYMIGNHEDWAKDLIDDMPVLEGIVSVERLLGLDRWEVIEQSGHYNIGKLTFLHGDTVKGGENCAKAAVIAYERNVRFGHFHTFSAYTKTSALSYKNAKTGVAVGCLCTKDPKYGEGKGNRWVQGFNYGWTDNNTFNDYFPIIVDGQFIAEGKKYKG